MHKLPLILTAMFFCDGKQKIKVSSRESGIKVLGVADHCCFYFDQQVMLSYPEGTFVSNYKWRQYNKKHFFSFHNSDKSRESFLEVPIYPGWWKTTTKEDVHHLY